uniref:Uncharacterized protein n=1 Tax=Sphaerodactylus townsendi TaxID=933632 RepID=A0ACB8FJS0_9SAUR
MLTWFYRFWAFISAFALHVTWPNLVLFGETLGKDARNSVDSEKDLDQIQNPASPDVNDDDDDSNDNDDSFLDELSAAAGGTITPSV